MAFKSMVEFNEERYSSLFQLSDKDYADVVFLYRNENDVQKASVHYLIEPNRRGYVHCCEVGCPLCATGKQGFKVQERILIPMYVISKNDEPVNQILFWDRSTYYYKYFREDTFKNYPMLSEYVFRISRTGLGKDDTQYKILLKGKNPFTYDMILQKYNVSFPAYYDAVIKSYTPAEIERILNANTANNTFTNVGDIPEYVPTPRAGYQSAAIPNAYVPVDSVFGSSTVPEGAPAIGSAEGTSTNTAEVATDNNSSDTSDTEDLPEVEF